MLNDPPPRRKWHLTRWFLVLIVATLSWSGWRAYAFRDALAQARALGWQVRYTGPVEKIRKNWKAAFAKRTWLDGVTYVNVPTGASFEQNIAIVYRLNPKALEILDAATLRDLSSLKPLTRLQQLWLSRCTGLTNVDALKNLSALQHVALRGCTGLKNVDGLKNLSALQVVIFTEGSGLANVDALKNLSALQEVSLVRCTGLTNVDVLKNLSALQNVSLVACTGLTNVDALMNLSALRRVDLTGCTALTPESVATLRAALPNANIIGP